MLLDFMTLSLYQEWLIITTQPLQLFNLSTYNITYIKYVNSAYMLAQKAKSLLEVLRVFNTMVISGHNHYFTFKLNFRDPLTNKELYSSVSRYHLSISQLNKFNSFYTNQLTNLRTLITTLDTINNIIRPSLNSVNNLFFIRNEVIPKYSRSLYYVTEAFSNLNLLHIELQQSFYIRDRNNFRKLWEVLDESDKIHYESFRKRYRKDLLSLKADLQYEIDYINSRNNLGVSDKLDVSDKWKTKL